MKTKEEEVEDVDININALIHDLMRGSGSSEEAKMEVEVQNRTGDVMGVSRSLMNTRMSREEIQESEEKLYFEDYKPYSPKKLVRDSMSIIWRWIG